MWESWLSWVSSRAGSHVSQVSNITKVEVSQVSYDVSQIGSREICRVIVSLVAKYKSSN